MALWQHYLTPGSVEAALAALKEAAGPARLIAGGTDLLLELQQGRHPPVDTLVDVSRIPEMRTIREENGRVYLGAAVTHAEVGRSVIINPRIRCLVQACGLIGGPQVQNVATIGGNVAHALPAADGTVALLALDAEAELATGGGRRWVRLEELFAGPGQVTFDRGREILVGFRFALPGSDQTTSFRRVMRPQGVAIAIMNMAVWVRWAPGGVIRDLRLGLGAAGARPLRARQTEAVLRGQVLEDGGLNRALQTLLMEAQVRTSPHRATADYRRHLLGVLLRRTLRAAQGDAERVEGAGVTGSAGSGSPGTKRQAP
jgi:carbon-monoxide dehydrogenase medium subunit